MQFKNCAALAIGLLPSLFVAAQCGFEIQFQTALACPFANDGAVTAIAVNGTGPFSYQWENDTVFTNQITGLDVGNYAVTVTDANGCSQTATVVLEAATRPTATAAPEAVTCFGQKDGAVRFIADDPHLRFSLLDSIL
ncbi:MAG: SprB repeat-containing protein, partial [Saprospiraceae bacterium]|nr:SprB repeat-containing protein [Saprospiraceae bacterium]